MNFRSHAKLLVRHGRDRLSLTAQEQEQEQMLARGASPRLF